MEIQRQHDELEANFFEERSALEVRYHELYEQLYTKRYEIVNGVAEMEVTTEMKSDAEDKNSKEKGVPGFWLTAMKTNEVLADKIQECDEEVLKFLKDIRWCRTDNPKGFKLDFYFEPNLFFKNLVLTKTYHMIDEDNLVLVNVIGTKIEWYPGKCLTHKVSVKRPRKKSKNMIPIPKREKCESFFNFFDPPQFPEDNDGIDEDSVVELQTQMRQDYDIGSNFRDKIIPRAISLFTGVAGLMVDSEDLDVSDFEDVDIQDDREDVDIVDYDDEDVDIIGSDVDGDEDGEQWSSKVGFQDEKEKRG